MSEKPKPIEAQIEAQRERSTYKPEDTFSHKREAKPIDIYREEGGRYKLLEAVKQERERRERREAYKLLETITQEILAFTALEKFFAVYKDPTKEETVTAEELDTILGGYTEIIPEVEIFRDIIRNYIIQNKRIQSFLDTVEEQDPTIKYDMQLYDEELYARLFPGIEPEKSMNDIDIEILPTAIYIQFRNPKDAGRAYRANGGYPSHVTDYAKYDEEGENMLGFQCRNSKFNISVIAENVTKGSKETNTKFHEYAHMLTGDIFIIGKLPVWSTLETNSYDGIKNQASSIFEQVQYALIIEGIDEFLSQLRGGVPPSEILSVLVSSYLHDHKEFIKEYCTSAIDNNPMIRDDTTRENLRGLLEYHIDTLDTESKYADIIERCGNIVQQIKDSEYYNTEELYIALAFQVKKSNSIEEMMDRLEAFKNAVFIQYAHDTEVLRRRLSRLTSIDSP